MAEEGVVQDGTQGAEGANNEPNTQGLVGTENLFGSDLMKNAGLSEEWQKLQEKKEAEASQEPTKKDPVSDALSKGDTKGTDGELGTKGEPEASVTPEANPEGGTTTDSESSEGVVIESPLFGGKKSLGGGDVKTEDTPSFENIEEVNSFLEKNHGIKDFTELSEKLGSLSEFESKLQQKEQELNSFNQLFTNMDPDLWEAVNAYANGKDWRVSLSTPTIDYSKDASQIEAKTLVEAFSSSKLTEEDWEEYNDPDGDENIKRMVDTVIETSKAAFNQQKQQKQLSAQQEVQKQQEAVQAFNTSLASAKEQLESEYSNIAPSAMAQIEDVFTKQGVASLFYNENGTLKEDAFKKVALAQYGDELIKQFEAAAMRKAENKVTQDILERVPETPRDNRGSASSQQPSGVRPDVQDIVNGMMGMEKRHF